MLLNKIKLLKKLLFLALFFFFLQPTHAKSNKDLSVPEIHARLKTLVNYSPDSSLALLDLAAKKIGQIKDKDLAAAYWAENNLRRADYWVYTDNEKAKMYVENAFYYYTTNPNDEKLAEIYCIKAQILKDEGHAKTQAIQNALPYFDSALVYAQRIADPALIAFIYYEKAFALQQIERWQESFENAFLSIQFAERSKDSLSMATAYFLMGRTYNYFGFSDHSENYIAKAIGYGKGMYRIYSILHIYADLLLENNKVEEALENYQIALDICLESKRFNKAIELYTNIGATQLKTGMYAEAEKTYATMRSLMAQEKYETVHTLLFSAQMHNYWGEKSSALKDLEKFKSVYVGAKLSAFSLNIYKDVADLFSILEHPTEAAFFYKKWGTIKDSLQTYTSRLQLSELEKMYLNEREKNQEITKQNIDLEASRRNQAALGGLMFVILLLGGGIVYYVRMRGLRENQALEFTLKKKQLEQLMEVQETERQRLARELHDGIGQSLAALKMQLQLADDVHTSSVTVKRVDALCKEVRMLSHQMMPLVLKENGLKAAVEQLIEQVFANTAIEVDLVTHSFDYRLPENVENHLYRMVQELIANILKHANATKVGVQLINRNNNILLIVEDNGKGFDTDNPQKGLGLNNLYARMEALAGNIKIQSSPTEGTFVRIAISIVPYLNKQTA